MELLPVVLVRVGLELAALPRAGLELAVLVRVGLEAVVLARAGLETAVLARAAPPPIGEEVLPLAVPSHRLAVLLGAQEARRQLVALRLRRAVD